MEAMTFVASKNYLPQPALAPCPSRGLEVRYFYLFGHDPACEIWKQGNRVYPPPFLVSRADRTKDDTILRVGDTLNGATISKYDLPKWGFSDPGHNTWTALLQFIAEFGDVDEYKIVLTIQKIIPKQDTQWDGRIVFLRSLVAGDTIVPVPNQSGSEERFKEVLELREIAEQLMGLAKIIEAFEGLMMDLIWGLTGGWEVKEATKIGEKYVARTVYRQAVKYMRPKFAAIAKAYVEAAVKEWAKQIFKKIGVAIREAAAGGLVTNTGIRQDGVITVDQIRLLQSSKKLEEARDHSKVDWEKVHAAAMEKALEPFWKLFKDSPIATGVLRRAVNTSADFIEKFFFKIGFLYVLQKAEAGVGAIINKLISDLTSEWIANVMSSGKPASEAEVERLAASKLDHSLYDRVKQWFEDNWEKLAKNGLKSIESDFIKAVRGTTGASAGAK
jgi:hypothetical protein